MSLAPHEAGFLKRGATNLAPGAAGRMTMAAGGERWPGLAADAEDMLAIFEGALSSCHDRGAISDAVFSAMVRRSQGVRKRLKRRIKERGL